MSDGNSFDVSTPQALELGIGTGRVAIPLALKGVDVTGIDSSSLMLKKLHAKKSPAVVTTLLDDMTEYHEHLKSFNLVYCVFNTITCLARQEDQLQLFINASKYLHRGGYFTIQADVPDPAYLQLREWVKIHSVNSYGVEMLLCQHDPIRQLIDYQFVSYREDKVQLFPARQRYVWAAEFDAMAAAANLRLVEREADWDGAPFKPTSQQHVSVYQKI
ncbi:class I SAM-dependent DNA methyltransferase [Streptomyces sp. NPDC048508]|uniref:class I SAM-dependent DNA methyltransferase n=1 Tax=Streptomyces sp. NPDC048508 TaxID=3365561 RepID=UPI00371DA766